MSSTGILIRAVGGFLRTGWVVEVFFSSGTEIAVSTPRTLITRFCGKLPCRNFLGDFLYLRLGFLQLHFAARRKDEAVVFQVIKNEAIRLVAPVLKSGERINRELQAFIGILLRARFACLVIHNDNTFVRQSVQTVNAAIDRRLAHADGKPLLCIQDLRLRSLTCLSKKTAQLGHALFLVEFVLVTVLDGGLGQV